MEYIAWGFYRQNSGWVCKTLRSVQRVEIAEDQFEVSLRLHISQTSGISDTDIAENV